MSNHNRMIQTAIVLARNEGMALTKANQYLDDLNLCLATGHEGRVPLVQDRAILFIDGALKMRSVLQVKA